jgi:protein-S-isoprenylcysteine O-methyltransferase Ste14
VPEERDFSLEVLVVMAIVVFTYIATAMSQPFESLNFKYRLGSWTVVFVGLWVLLLIWWHRNNGDRRLLNRALRQIRGIGGL